MKKELLKRWIKSIPKYILLLIIFYTVELIVISRFRIDPSYGHPTNMRMECIWLISIFIYLLISLILLVVSSVRKDDTYKNVILLNILMVVIYNILT